MLFAILSIKLIILIITTKEERFDFLQLVAWDCFYEKTYSN